MAFHNLNRGKANILVQGFGIKLSKQRFGSSGFQSESDLYKVLGLSQSASQLEIKKAYYNLAKIYHPDVKNTQGSENEFKAINSAYEILSSPEKKQLYDSTHLNSENPKANNENSTAHNKDSEKSSTKRGFYTGGSSDTSHRRTSYRANPYDMFYSSKEKGNRYNSFYPDYEEIKHRKRSEIFLDFKFIIISSSFIVFFFSLSSKRINSKNENRGAMIGPAYYEPISLVSKENNRMHYNTNLESIYKTR